MTTYTEVMVLVVGAAVLILLAVWWRAGSDGRRRERRWVALGGSFTAAPGRPSWVSSVRVPGRPVEGIDLTAPGATLTDVIASQLGPALAVRPAVAVIWVGPDDLLHGRPLPAFLSDLRHVIDRCRQDGVAVLVVGMPRIGWPDDLPGRRPERPMSLSHTEWRTGIADVARYGGAELVIASERRDDGRPAVVREGRWTLLTNAARGTIGFRLAVAIARALQPGATADALLDGRDEPGDPVVRRRIGLPPVR